MNEYDVSFYALQDGGFAIDVHKSTGTSPFAKFESIEEVRSFFSSLGISEEKLAEIEQICSTLTPGHAYHDRMFLPAAVIEGLENLIAEGDRAVNVPVPPNGAVHPATAHRV